MLCIINVMQKIVNVLAIASSVVSLAVVGGGIYVYTQKDAIIEDMDLVELHLHCVILLQT